MNESNEKKIEGEKLTIEDVFQRRLEILSNPTAFTQKIAHFCAGGLGACVYSKDVSIAELVHYWEFDEFKFSCPEWERPPTYTSLPATQTEVVIGHYMHTVPNARNICIIVEFAL